MKKLRNNLKNLLHNAKISENELSRRTGVPQQVINRILSGENKNPKIATLSPLANYFMVSISQLIGDDIQASETKLNTQHSGWQEIPLIDWKSLGKSPLDELLSNSKDKLSIDITPADKVFAVRMVCNSMEPKFTEGTLLIFDPYKKPSSGDFVLLHLSDNEVIVRQIFIKKGKIYKKCLNPRCKDYKLTLLSQDCSYLGSLIQSRTDYITR